MVIVRNMGVIDNEFIKFLKKMTQKSNCCGAEIKSYKNIDDTEYRMCLKCKTLYAPTTSEGEYLCTNCGKGKVVALCSHIDPKKRELCEKCARVIILGQAPQKTEQLKMNCPVCNKEYDDDDGFGVQYCPACGYCTHASITGDICEFCNKIIPQKEPTPAPQTESEWEDIYIVDDSIVIPNWSVVGKQNELTTYQLAVKYGIPVKQYIRHALTEARREKDRKLVDTVKKWRKTHFPDATASWHIQNLLGDYLGTSKEHKEIFESLLAPTKEGGEE